MARLHQILTVCVNMCVIKASLRLQVQITAQMMQVNPCMAFGSIFSFYKKKNEAINYFSI